MTTCLVTNGAGLINSNIIAVLMRRRGASCQERGLRAATALAESGIIW